MTIPHPPHPWRFLAAAWAINVSVNAFYIAPAPVFSDMIRDLGISNAQAGTLVSIYLLAILLFQIPAGFVIDRSDPRRIVVLASIALLLLSVAILFLSRYDAILFLRFVAGIPVAFIFVPSAFLVSRAFSGAPGRAIGVFLSAPPAGVAIGNLFGPGLADRFGWPIVFVAYTVPLVAFIPMFAFSARALPVQDRERFTLADYAGSFRGAELWKVGLAFACSYAAYIFYSSWSPTYLRATASESSAFVGVTAAAIPAIGIFSRPLGGHLAEIRYAKDKRIVPMLGFVLLAIVSIAIPFSGLAGVGLLVACGFLAQFPFSVYYLFSAQIMPGRFRGTAFAFMNTTSLIGGAVSPGFAGFLVDLTGSFTAAFAMIALNAILGLLVVVTIRER